VRVLTQRELPDPATPAAVRFLPTFDATLLAHARRALQPFRRLDAADRRAVEEEGERLATFHS